LAKKWQEFISDNVRDIRSFSGTKWKKNLSEGRAEPRTVYPLLYAPTTVGRRAQRGATERSEFKKYFSFNFILTGFLFNNHKIVFCFGFWAEGLGVNAQNPKLLIFYH